MSSSSEVPKEVVLDEARKTFVGRCFTETDMTSIWVTLNSPKIPGMLSKTHSVLTFDEDHRQWTIEDLKSLNGVYVNKKKLEPSAPQALKEGDEVCFGAAIPKNVFKYMFILRDGKYLLSRKRKRTTNLYQDSKHDIPHSSGNINFQVGVVHPSDTDTDVPISQNSETILNSENDLNLTPPLRKTSKLEEDDLVSSRPSVAPVLDEQHAMGGREVNVSTRNNGITVCSASSTEPLVGSPAIVTSHQSHNSSPSTLPTYLTNTQVPANTSISSSMTVLNSLCVSPSSLPPCSATKATPITTVSSPLLSTSSHSTKPSPAVSCTSYTSTATEVDDLFDSIIKRSDSTLLDEAIFGGNEPSKPSTSEKLDGATIQVMIAKNEMEQEKHNLLSSIEALKSELAAKNDMIAKKKDDEKLAKKGVVASMKEEFTCVICQELFIRPHTLPCSHTFCEWCIKNWFKSQKLECPICRVKTVGHPVKSIVLDNAIAMLEDKLSESEREEREKMKKDHEQYLQKHQSGPVVVVNKHPYTSGARNNPIVLNETLTETSESETESETEDSDEEPDYYGHRGYGGYGRCFNCGERGHWRPQCPYR